MVVTVSRQRSKTEWMFSHRDKTHTRTKIIFFSVLFFPKRNSRSKRDTDFLGQILDFHSQSVPMRQWDPEKQKKESLFPLFPERKWTFWKLDIKVTLTEIGSTCCLSLWGYKLCDNRESRASESCWLFSARHNIETNGGESLLLSGALFLPFFIPASGEAARRPPFAREEGSLDLPTDRKKKKKVEGVRFVGLSHSHFC